MSIKTGIISTIRESDDSLLFFEYVKGYIACADNLDDYKLYNCSKNFILCLKKINSEEIIGFFYKKKNFNRNSYNIYHFTELEPLNAIYTIDMREKFRKNYLKKRLFAHNNLIDDVKFHFVAKICSDIFRNNIKRYLHTRKIINKISHIGILSNIDVTITTNESYMGNSFKYKIINYDKCQNVYTKKIHHFNELDFFYYRKNSCEINIDNHIFII